MSDLDGRRMSADERATFLRAIREMLQAGELTFGQALRVLRAAWLGVDRERFAKMVGVSVRELAKIETDRANSTMKTLDRVFRPFGLRVGLVPVARDVSAGEAAPEALGVAIRAAIERHSRSRRPR